jgi:hypothetical protein
MSMENHGGMISTRDTTDSPTKALWQSKQQPTNSKAGGTGVGSNEFCLLKYIFHTSKRSLTRSNILRRAAHGCASTPNKFVLRVFIALVNPLLSAGFEPSNLGSTGKCANH